MTTLMKTSFAALAVVGALVASCGIEKKSDNKKTDEAREAERHKEINDLPKTLVVVSPKDKDGQPIQSLTRTYKLNITTEELGKMTPEAATKYVDEQGEMIETTEDNNGLDGDTSTDQWWGGYNRFNRCCGGFYHPRWTYMNAFPCCGGGAWGGANATAWAGAGGAFASAQVFAPAGISYAGNCGNYGFGYAGSWGVGASASASASVYSGYGFNSAFSSAMVY